VDLPPGPESAAGAEATPAPPSPGDAGQVSVSPRHKLEAWLAEMVRQRASDLILRAGGRPSCRIDGRIHFLPGRVPAAGPMLEVLEGIVGSERMASWKERGSVDTALQLDGLGRFRLNAYKQMGEPALVLRRIATDAPLLSTLCLPTVQLERVALRKRGLVLVTGIAGSGKSTAMAAMIQFMNTHAERHVITLEDPVELLFSEDRCVISQREVGTDCSHFADGLRHALRQSPDVILIGEMRDGETVSAALDATETGHLVMSTLHTVNAPQTVDRILSFFPGEQHQQVRQRLAENVSAVLSLRLLPRKSGKGMVPACELLLSTPRVRELLYEGQVNELSRVVEAGVEEGLLSFNQSLRLLVQQDFVELEVALAASDRPEELLLALRGYSKGQPKSQAAAEAPVKAGGPRLRLASGE
jgi:twitching motility protein PilT